MPTLDPTRAVRQATISASLALVAASLLTHLAGTSAAGIPVYTDVTFENLGDQPIEIANMPQGFTGNPGNADFTALGAGESEPYDIVTLRTCFIRLSLADANAKVKFRGKPATIYV